MSRALVICGATGKQGGAVIKHLLQQNNANDFEILAVTRNAASASAQRLLSTAPAKIKLLQGDLLSPAALFQTAQQLTKSPIWGVFGVQVAIGSGSEVAEGKGLVDAALAAGVSLFVYTSVDRHGESDSFTNPTPIPHFAAKHAIEHYLVDNAPSKNMSWTILRPVAFMENLTDNYFGRVFIKSWDMVVRDKPLQLVAVSDIGFFAGEAFLKPDEYKGRAISLAGDELTLTQARKVFAAKAGGAKLPTTNGVFPWLLMKLMKDLSVMYRWFYDQGYAADIPALRKVNPGLKDFGTWLETESDFADKIKRAAKR
ncbi:NmrA-like family protein [Lasiosphaeria ovina]|uniref:NmrA-like family protein n=1 Tax=Lasiosphaeria ovina TaxID=92902 RepID=A0AAE0MXI8_9PEZI|nr:NmrA-like family protein [Lasiosphaeria ovina]